MSNFNMSKFSNQEVFYFAVRLGMSVGGFAGAVLGYWVSHTFLGVTVGGSIGAVVGFGTGVLVAFTTLVNKKLGFKSLLLFCAHFISVVSNAVT